MGDPRELEWAKKPDALKESWMARIGTHMVHGVSPYTDYVKIFGQVFSEEGFAKLPNCKPWDHVIELVPGAQPKGCKVYPILVTEQSELDRFLHENLETGCIRQSKSPMASLVFFIKKKDGSL
jgi:hypothetical protein